MKDRDVRRGRREAPVTEDRPNIAWCAIGEVEIFAQVDVQQTIRQLRLLERLLAFQDGTIEKAHGLLPDLIGAQYTDRPQLRAIYDGSCRFAGSLTMW